MRTDDTFRSRCALSCTKYLHRTSFWLPKTTPLVGLGWISRKKLYHSLLLQRQAPCPFLSITNYTSHWEWGGGMRGTTKATQLCVHAAAPLLFCKGKLFDTWPHVQKQWHWT